MENMVIMKHQAPSLHASMRRFCCWPCNLKWTPCGTMLNAFEDTFYSNQKMVLFKIGWSIALLNK